MFYFYITSVLMLNDYFILRNRSTYYLTVETVAATRRAERVLDPTAYRRPGRAAATHQPGERLARYQAPRSRPG